MTLEEMGEDYRARARIFYGRITELRGEARDPALSETERILLRRRICVLETMERELRSTGLYLKNYYGRNDHDTAGMQGRGAAAGIPGPAAVPEAGGGQR